MEVSDKPFVIYHGGCADGFGAAWVVWKFLGGMAEFFPGYYGKNPPEVHGRDVIMVDFSYKRPELEVMVVESASLLVLDHHKSARDELDFLPDAMRWDHHLAAAREQEGSGAALFDMDRSGAGLAWDYFYSDHNGRRPHLIDFIEDRDLWRFKRPGSREIHASLMSYAMEFEVWDEILHRIERIDDRAAMISGGTGILRKHDKDVASIVKNGRREIVIGGIKVPVVNCNRVFGSDAANILAKGQPFAASYCDWMGKWQFELRSAHDGGVDVSAIAESYGGGGHFHAAGFSVPHDKSLQFEVKAP